MYSKEKFVSAKLENAVGKPKYEDYMEILWRYIIGMSIINRYISILKDHP